MLSRISRTALRRSAGVRSFSIQLMRDELPFENVVQVDDSRSLPFHSNVDFNDSAAVAGLKGLLYYIPCYGDSGKYYAHLFKRMQEEVGVGVVTTDLVPLGSEGKEDFTFNRPADKELMLRNAEFLHGINNKFAPEKMFIAGHSLGALTSVRLAQFMAPDFFSGMILLNPVFDFNQETVGITNFKRGLWVAKKMMGQSGKSACAPLKNLVPDPLLDFHLNNAMQSKEIGKQGGLRISVDSYINAYRSQDEAEQRVKRWTTPSLILQADNDFWADNTKTDWMFVEAKKVTHKKKHSIMTRLGEETSHFMPLVDPACQEVEKEMVRFVERLVFNINIKLR